MLCMKVLVKEELFLTLGLPFNEQKIAQTQNEQKSKRHQP